MRHSEKEMCSFLFWMVHHGIWDKYIGCFGFGLFLSRIYIYILYIYIFIYIHIYTKRCLLRSDDAYKHNATWSPLVPVMACFPIGAKPLTIKILKKSTRSFKQIFLIKKIIQEAHLSSSTTCFKHLHFKNKCWLTHCPLGNFHLSKLNLIFVNDGWGISGEVPIRETSLVRTYDKPTLVQVMAWCRQATSHYLSQCWPRFVSPYGFTRPQWVTHNEIRLLAHLKPFLRNTSTHLSIFCNTLSVIMIMSMGVLIIRNMSSVTWWRHQMESFPALLALCAGDSPVTGEFPSQMLLRRSFGIFFHLRPNKRLSKQSRRRWFETPSWSLWRHCNAEEMLF